MALAMSTLGALVLMNSLLFPIMKLSLTWMRLVLLSAILGCLTPTSWAFSLPIPKTVVDQGLVAKFPKERYGLKLESPVTRFKADVQKVELCGVWRFKLPAKSGDFCLDFHPLWNKDKGDIEMSALNILKLTAGNDEELPSQTQQLLNSMVVPVLDGASLYHVPDMVGKHIEKLNIAPNAFELVF